MAEDILTALSVTDLLAVGVLSTWIDCSLNLESDFTEPFQAWND